MAFSLTLVVALSVMLLLAHIFAQIISATRELGSAWNVGPRDSGLGPMSIISQRAARASANFRETYPAFIALVVVIMLAGTQNFLAITGAWLWFSARVIYLPVYLAGITYVRSLIWLVSILGLMLMLAAVFL